MEGGETAVECRQPACALTDKFSQPGISDLPVPLQPVMADFFVTKAIQPELMTLHLTQLRERVPSGHSRRVWGRHHV